MTIFTYCKKGMTWGFLFGTVGLFVLSVLSLMSPVIEMLAQPFLWPGRQFSAWLTDGVSASTSMVVVLYLLTGAFYALVGMVVQIVFAALRRST